MMTKYNKLLIGIIGAAVVAGFVLGVFGFMKGTQEPRSDIPADIAEHIGSKSDLIVVDEPNPLEVITSPFTVRGQARGSWYFEANFQLTLVDWNGRIIAESFATAQDNWMTEGFVPFEGTIEFELSEENRVYDRGTLIFQKANPSGLPEHDDSLEIPILFE